MEDIARNADVGVATIYRRWPDKSELANYVYRRVMDAIDFAMNQEPKPGSTRFERFFLLWRSYCDFATAFPEMFLFLEGQPHDAFIDADNRKRKANQDRNAEETVSELGITISAELARAIAVGTIAQCIRTGVEFDVDDVGQRLWTALTQR